MEKILDWVEKHFVKAIVLSVVTVILLLVLVLFSVARAAEVNVSWTHPTQYTDNTALGVANLKETQVQYGTCTTATTPTFNVLTAEVVVPAPAATVKLLAVSPGTYCFRARVTDLQLRVSNWSVVVSKAIVEIKPKAPTTVVIQ